MPTKKDHSHHVAARPWQSNNSISPLSAGERGLLEDYEDLITKGLETFFEVGNALLAIREGRLYRFHYETFDAYCSRRWGFGRSYAWRVMGAAERLKLLPATAEQKPTSEFQMRPFLRLKPEEFPHAWKRVLDEAKDGRITSKLIGSLLTDYTSGRRVDKQPKSPKPRTVTLNRTTIAEILILLHNARRRVEANQADQAIVSLDRVEQLLFQPQVVAAK